MRTEDRSIDRAALARFIERAYAVEVTSIEYVPLGECSHDYRLGTVARGDLFAKIHTHTPSQRARWDRGLLNRRLAAVAALHDDCGVAEVVAPLRALDGSHAVEHPAGPLALFPCIEGGWVAQHGRTEADTRAEGRLIGAVHACPPARVFAEAPDLVETLEISYAGVLARLMTEGIEAGDDDPAYPIRALLRENRDEILAAHRYLEELGAAGRGSTDGWVATHGDPTQGNNLKTPNGRIYLVDWDGILLGPPERDIVFFGGRSFGTFLDGYREFRPAPTIHAELIAFYLYHWDLQEVADWGWRLIREEDTTEKAFAWRELSQYLPVRKEWIAQRAQEMASA